MKKIKRRATSALLIAALIVTGLTVFLTQLADDGGAWASFAGNSGVYANGVLDTGTVTDRNGVVLAEAGNGTYSYAGDQETRVSCLHAVGDYAGNIGTGALSAFADKLIGYSFLTGVKPGGETVELTIDATLCVGAYRALAGRKGAVLVSNYKTGEILCMVSSPSYDPNGAPDQSLDGVYINRCISAAYTPGSVFKLVTLAAAVENIGDLYDRSFWCGGSVDVGGDTVACTGSHGTQTIEQALANSCNVAFSELALELGADTLSEYAEKLGLSGGLKLDGIQTADGKFVKEAAGGSLLAWSAIGQAEDLVTPYAMLRYVSAIANGGTVTEPTILGYGVKKEKTALLSEDTAEKIAGMMDYNVEYAYGASNFPGLEICAKTGTAERGDGTTNAWFAGFLKDDAHPYSFTVVVEGTGGGGLSAAGGVANAVLQAAVN